MKMLGTSLALVVGLLMAQAAVAGEECCGAPDQCGRCGCRSNCGKYCKVVPATKEIKKHVWVVKCEDFCPSMPGCGKGGCGGCGRDGCCGECQQGCGETCDKCCGKGCDQCPKVHCVKPACGCPRTRKILEKKEIICKIDCWKCEVVYACSGCGEGCSADGFAPAPAGDAAPAPAPAPRLETPPAPPLPPGPRGAR